MDAHIQDRGDDGNGPYVVWFLEPPLGQGAPKATAGQTDRVWSRTLAILGLEARHAQHLDAERHICADRQAELKFATLPTGAKRKEVLAKLEREFDRDLLLTVAGFVEKKNGDLDFAISGSGILIPHMDGDSVAWVQVRLDKPGRAGRYMTMGGNGGPSADLSAYEVPATTEQPFALVTEGAFKALAAQKAWGCLSLGAPGIGAVSRAFRVLREKGVAEVLFAPDADYRTNTGVFKSVQNAITRLRSEGFLVRLLTWDGAKGKGIDDALAAGAEFATVEGAELDAHLQGVAELLGVSAAPTPDQAVADVVIDDDAKNTVFARALAKAEELFQFFAYDGTGYLSPGNGVAHSLESSSARKLVLLRLHRATGKTPSADAVQRILDLKGAEVTLEGPFRPVFRRVGEHQGVHYLDLCRPDGKVVKMTAAGWEQVDAPSEVYFRRTGSVEEALPDPVRGGDVMLLAELLNAPTQAVKFMVGYLTACLRPGRPWPLLVLEGSAGSAKTTASKVIKFLIDPERAMANSLPKNEHDMAVSCAHSHVQNIDNVDKLKPEQQDMFCRVATGAHHKTKKLYTDSDQSSLALHAPVIMSGLEGLVDRADLGSRVALVALESIGEGERITEDEIWEKARRHRPHILGGILDAFVAGLKNLDRVHLTRKPRMVDFAKFITAAEIGLPWTPGEALAFFLSSQANLAEQALGKDRVALAIIRLMQHRDTWTGTVNDLLSDLVAPAGGEDYWPSTPHKLARRVIAAVPLLEARGIGFSKPPRSKHGVVYSFLVRKEISALSAPVAAILDLPTTSLVNLGPAKLHQNSTKFTVPVNKYTEPVHSQNLKFTAEIHPKNPVVTGSASPGVHGVLKLPTLGGKSPEDEDTAAAWQAEELEERRKGGKR